MSSKGHGAHPWVLKTENDPEIAELSNKVLEARNAERKLGMLKDFQVQPIDYEFGDNEKLILTVEFQQKILETSNERVLNSINSNSSG